MTKLKVKSFLTINNSFKINQELQTVENKIFLHLCQLRQKELINKDSGNLNDKLIVSFNKVKECQNKKISKRELEGILINIEMLYSNIIKEIIFNDEVEVKFNDEIFNKCFMEHRNGNFQILPIEIIKDLKDTKHIILLMKILETKSFTGFKFIMVEELKTILNKQDILQKTLNRDIKRMLEVINKIKLFQENGIEFKLEYKKDKFIINQGKIFEFKVPNEKKQAVRSKITASTDVGNVLTSDEVRKFSMFIEEENEGQN